MINYAKLVVNLIMQFPIIITDLVTQQYLL
jgi:hypothetical protein